MTAPPARTVPGTRCTVVAAAGASVHHDPACTGTPITILAAGTTVLCAATDTDAGTIRIQSPTGWVRAASLSPAPPVAPLRLSRPDFDARHLDVVAGDRYGIPVPHTLDLLSEAGPDFLTDAFRAAGTLGEDNAVRDIVSLERIGVKGASDNAYLTLRYERDEPGLVHDLFVKVPPVSPAQKFSLSPMAHGEIEMYRLARDRAMPVPIPRYLFGDYCSTTTNFVLITERVGYGKAPVEPAYRKGYDHEVPEIDEHYRVLARALGTLVAAHRTGRLGTDIEDRFPFPRAARSFAPVSDAPGKLERLVRFVGHTAPHLFGPKTTSSGFLDTWADDVLFGLVHRDPVIRYLHADLDYTGLCHTNLNVDNAWFWRDGAGTLHAGLLDWGGAGQLSLGQALSGMLMMPDPDHYLTLVDDVIDEFRRSVFAHGGPALVHDTLRRHHQASLWSTALCTIVDLLVDALERIPAERYRAFGDRHDPALRASGMGTIVIWIDNMLREWTTPHTPGEICREIVAAA